MEKLLNLCLIIRLNHYIEFYPEYLKCLIVHKRYFSKVLKKAGKSSLSFDHIYL